MQGQGGRGCPAWAPKDPIGRLKQNKQQGQQDVNPEILVDTAGAGQENAADGNLQDLTLSCDADRAECANASSLVHNVLGGGGL